MKKNRRHFNFFFCLFCLRPDPTSLRRSVSALSGPAEGASNLHIMRYLVDSVPSLLWCTGIFYRQGVYSSLIEGTKASPSSLLSWNKLIYSLRRHSDFLSHPVKLLRHGYTMSLFVYLKGITSVMRQSTASKQATGGNGRRHTGFLFDPPEGLVNFVVYS